MLIDTMFARDMYQVYEINDDWLINDPSRQYELTNIIAMYNSIFRYLNSKGYEHNIKTSELFRHSRKVVSSKMKELKQIGKGNKPFVAQPFTTEDFAMM